jgi:hypothetical protein
LVFHRRNAFGNEGRPHVSRARITVLRLLAETAETDALQSRVDTRENGRRARRIGLEVLEHDAEGRIGLERGLSGQRLEENDTHGVQVAAGVDLFAAGLLRRKVIRRSDDRPDARELFRARRAGVCGKLRDSEVADFDVLGRVALVVRPPEDDDVVGLQISMDNPELVRRGEGREGLTEDVHDARRLEGRILAEDVVEAAAIQVLHHDVEQAVGLLPEVEHPHGVRVIDARCGHGFALESRDERRLEVELGMQNFDGHDLVETRLAGAIDGSHPPPAQIRLDDVLVGDGPGDELGLQQVRIRQRRRRSIGT